MEIAKFYEADVYIASEEEDVIERCKEETDGEGPRYRRYNVWLR